MTDTKKTRTITLSSRRPVKIVEDDWPLIARATMEVGAYGPGMTPRPDYEVSRCTIRVRQHADGRAIVYVTADHSGSIWGHHVSGCDGGRLYEAGQDLATAIMAVGTECEAPEETVRECIADLPAETI